MSLGPVSIKTLPKVLLHDHLDGGLRPETVLELSLADGVRPPAEDPMSLAEWFFIQANSGSLERYLLTFEQTLAVMQTTENLVRVAREAVVDLAADAVVHAEIRFAPEQHQRLGLSLEQVVDAVQAGVREGQVEVARTARPISVGLILCAMRQGNCAEAIAEVALAYRDRGVVGFDLAGPEAGFPAGNYSDALSKLHQELFPITIHAGEGDGVRSIWAAVSAGWVRRIGHGARLVEDIEGYDTPESLRPRWGQARPQGGVLHPAKLGSLANWIRDWRIALEICPTSNIQTGLAASFAEHPISVLKQLGFAVTLNTDNRLMSDTSMSHEAVMLFAEANWSIADLRDVTLNAVRAAFLHADQRAALVRDVITPAYTEALARQ